VHLLRGVRRGVLLGTCPNCGGGFVPRPLRPARDLKGGNFLGKYPAAPWCGTGR
jgi:hypothetical protein